jgi:hypothetical protein
VDEYPDPGRPGWSCRPASSARPLTLGQVIALIDGAQNPDLEPGREGPLTDLLRDQDGADLDDLVDFVRVESDFYPGLSEYFERRAEEWLRRKRRELGDDDEDEGECNADG